MSGGGNKVVKGRMGLFIVVDISFDQLEVMEKILEKEIKIVEVSSNCSYWWKVFKFGESIFRFGKS